MINIDLRCKRKCLLFSASMLAVLIVIYLLFGSNSVIAEIDNNTTVALDQRAKAASVQATNDIATQAVGPSLEMKENVDFLLSPALLIQEVLSDDIVTTYPSE